MLLSLLNRPKSSLASQLKLIVNDLRIIHVTELTKQHDQVVLYVAEGDVGDKEQGWHSGIGIGAWDGELLITSVLAEGLV